MQGHLEKDYLLVLIKKQSRYLFITRSILKYLPERIVYIAREGDTGTARLEGPHSLK
jgi:hypothetical protein